MNVKIESSWKTALKEEFTKPYFIGLTDFVRNEYKTKTVYPPPKLIFNAFEQCAFDDVSVVILGQDPYHGANQAHGLCFSVNDDIAIPPSLQNIYKEIANDVGDVMPSSGNLLPWTKQGVFLLNATLTVSAHRPMSHNNKGWEIFTNAVIEKISDEHKNIVFMLWGKSAQARGANINKDKHLILTAPHPSPFSAHSGFFGCKHFSKANDYLANNKRNPIKWI